MSTEKADPTVQPVTSENSFYGKTNPSPDEHQKMEVKRFGAVVGIEPEKEDYYREMHANVWPGVIARLQESNVRNYSIYITELEGKKYLFSYMEYVGENFEEDMKKMADDETTQKWWKEMAPCQIRLPNRKPGAQWSERELVFFME